MSKTNKTHARPPKPLKVLFADDEVPLQELIADELPRMGCTVKVCPDGTSAVAAIEKEAFDCLIVDLDMPGLNGIEVIARAKEISPLTEAIVLTGKSSKDTAIAALRLGAFDYLQKPCTLIELQTRLKRVAEKRELTKRVVALETQLKKVEGSQEMIGKHPRIEAVRQLIRKVAPTDTTVLITGETGTGKELAARAVHEQSDRASKPFLAINCGALPESLIESELFGHKKGAFTGAEESRSGLFEVADGGTLFLDEIGELPTPIQAKLLRVLETGEVRRVGDNMPFKVDVRVIAATHRDLADMASKGTFRSDLMYRVNTFEIRIPSLRERIEDIPSLAVHLLSRHRATVNLDNPGITDAAIGALKGYAWPGNIRELANVIEHASILCEELPVDIGDLPANLQTGRPAMTNVGGQMTLREIEEQAILASLDRHHGNKTAASEELGISIKTLYNKLNQSSFYRAA